MLCDTHPPYVLTRCTHPTHARFRAGWISLTMSRHRALRLAPDHRRCARGPIHERTRGSNEMCCRISDIGSVRGLGGAHGAGSSVAMHGRLPVRRLWILSWSRVAKQNWQVLRHCVSAFLAGDQQGRWGHVSRQALPSRAPRTAKLSGLSATVLACTGRPLHHIAGTSLVSRGGSCPCSP